MAEERVRDTQRRLAAEREVHSQASCQLESHTRLSAQVADSNQSLEGLKNEVACIQQAVDGQQLLLKDLRVSSWMFCFYCEGTLSKLCGTLTWNLLCATALCCMAPPGLVAGIDCGGTEKFTLWKAASQAAVMPTRD